MIKEESFLFKSVAFLKKKSIIIELKTCLHIQYYNMPICPYIHTEREGEITQLKKGEALPSGFNL